MTTLFSRRFWRSLGVKLLPESIKSPLRRHLHGWHAGSSPLNAMIEETERGPVLKVDRLLSLNITDAIRHNASVQLIENADCIDESRIFLELAENANTFFDVGAYAGLFSLLFCSLDKQKRAVAFEPSPVMKPHIEELINLNQFEAQLRLKPKAIGNEEGTLAFNLEDTGFVQIMKSDRPAKSVNVEVTTLDLECKRLNLYPDLLKIDVEGFELEALQGGHDLLRTKKPIICLEIHLNYLEERGVSPKLITDELEKHNYQFFSCRQEPLKAEQIYDSIKPVVHIIAK